MIPKAFLSKPATKVELTLIILLFLFFTINCFANKATQQLKPEERAVLVDKAGALIIQADEKSLTVPHEGKQLAFEAVGIALLLQDEEILTEAYTKLGINYLNIGQNDSARLYSLQSEVTNRNVHDKEISFGVFNLRGRVCHEFQQYDSAVYYFMACNQIGIELSNDSYQAASYNNLGMVYDSQGNLKEAYENYLHALEFYEKTGEEKNEAIVLNNLGLINQGLGEMHKSIDFLKKAIEINQELGQNIHLCMSYSNLGISYKELNMCNEALAALDSSLKLAFDNNLYKDQARAYLNIANIFMKMSEFDKAEESYLKSLKLCQENEIQYGIMLNYYALGSLYYTTKHFLKAEEMLNRALEIANETNTLRMVKDIYNRLSEVYEKMGQTDKALDFSRQYNKLNDSLTSLKNSEFILDLQTRYETEKKELENLSLKLENENKSKTIRIQQLYFYFVATGLLLLSIPIFVALSSRQKIKKSNNRLKELNQMFIAQNENLEQLNATKDKLFSIIAHDLRSPFNSLLGFLQVIIEDYDSVQDDEKKRVFESLFSHSNYTYALLENLLTWAMSQRGQISFLPTNIESYNVVQA
ncbi:MAG: tetratricopeptide repeat protein, partial [Bacteroidales bacterium]|nr:tetratricopeptide repeat protein [Bacteroidales bacterium]